MPGGLGSPASFRPPLHPFSVALAFYLCTIVTGNGEHCTRRLRWPFSKWIGSKTLTSILLLVSWACLLLLGLSSGIHISTYDVTIADLYARVAAAAVGAAMVGSSILLELRVLRDPNPAIASATTSQGAATQDALPVMLQPEALKLLISRLANVRGRVELDIWGFSLQWATPVYRFLRDNARPHLSVRLFMAGSPAWAMDIDYGAVSKSALMKRKDTTIHEWLGLASNKRVRDLRVFEVPLLPNDKGVRLGGQVTLFADL